MKNLIVPATTVAITLCISYFVFGQERIPHDINAVQTPACVGDNTLLGRLADYCPVRQQMAQYELQNQMVTNADGGIIILAGSRLLKYDRDLNLLRRVDLDVDINERIRNIRENDIKISELIRFYWF
jgi:hypothetical protein